MCGKMEERSSVILINAPPYNCAIEMFKSIHSSKLAVTTPFTGHFVAMEQVVQQKKFQSISYSVGRTLQLGEQKCIT